MFRCRHCLPGMKLVFFVLVLLLASLLVGSLPVLADGGSCIDDVTGRTNNCTANDVELGTFYNVEPVTCEADELITVYLRADLVAGANERYDIGMFVATDGGYARTGVCYRDYLPSPLAGKGAYVPGSPLPGPDGGPFYGAELKEDPDDVCGDLEQGVHTYYDLAPATGITLPCLDSNGDGTLDVSACVSWDNKKDNTCEGVNDAVPNTKAKCRCGRVEVGNVVVIPGEIQAYKAASPDDLDEPGGDVQFTFAVTNTSEVAVTITVLEDSVYGNLTTIEGSTCTVPQPLTAGASYRCSFTQRIAGEPGTYPDTFTASGLDENQNEVTDSAAIEVLINDSLPAIGVVKTANPLLVLAPGGPVTYTVQVTNNSGVSDTLTLTSLMDDVYGDLTAAGNLGISNSTCEMATVKPGESYQCTFTANVSGEVGDTVTDRLTAVGEDEEGNQVEASDDAAVEIGSEPPDTGVGVAPPLVVGGLAMLGTVFVAAGAWVRRRTLPAGGG